MITNVFEQWFPTLASTLQTKCRTILKTVVLSVWFDVYTREISVIQRRIYLRLLVTTFS